MKNEIKKIKDIFEEHVLNSIKDPEIELKEHLISRKPLYNNIFKFIKRNDIILEAGCSTAIDSGYIQKKMNCKSFACDISKAQIDKAKLFSSIMKTDISFSCQDIFNFGFSNEKFDIVFSQGVIEHFKEPLLTLKEHVRILKKGGYLIIDVPQKFSFYTLNKRKMIKQGIWPYGIETEYSKSEMKKWADELDIEIIEFFGYGYDRFLSIVRNFPYKLSKKLKTTGKRTKNIIKKWNYIGNLFDNIFGAYTAINIVGIYKKK